MIEFIAAKFINWHYLQESAVLPMAGGVFITGSNRAGKSTLLDALQFAALVQTDGFNQAANNDSSKRTRGHRSLIGYGRALVTMSDETDDFAGGDEYVRTGQTVSHVVIELYDNREKKSILLGASLEFGDYAVNPQKCNRIWWLAYGQKINTVNFFKETEKGKVVLTVKELSDQFPLRRYEKQQEIKSDLSFLFGLTKKRTGDPAAFDSWVRVMHSALLCDTKKMGDMDAFLTEYVFPEHKVDVSHLDESISTLQQFKSQLHQMETNLAMLREIKDTYLLYLDREKDIVSSTLKQQLLNYFDWQREIDQKKDTIRAIEPKITVVGQELQKLDQQIAEVNQRIGKLRASMSARDDIKRELDRLSAERKQLERQRSELQAGADKAWKFVTSINDLLGRRLKDLPAINELRSQGGAPTEQGVAAAVTGLENYSETYRTLKSEEAKRNTDLREQLAQVTGEISRLERRELGQDKHREVKRVISEAFQSAGIHDRPTFFCELLEWKDKEFQASIEAHLGQDRFNLFVSPKGYLTAAKAYREYVKTHPDCYGIKIVDTRYYAVSRRTAEENSLASALKAENDFAQRYLDDRFGRVMLVDDASDPPDKSRTSIDKDGMRYSGNTYTRMRPVQDMLIGQKAQADLLRKKKALAQKLQREQEKCLSRIKAIQSISSLLGTVDWFRINCTSVYANIQRIPGLLQQEQQKEHLLEEQDKKPEAVQIKDAEKELEGYSAQKQAKQQEQSNLQRQLDMAQNVIAQRQSEITQIDPSVMQQKYPQEYAAAEVYAKKNLYRHQLAAKDLQAEQEKAKAYLQKNASHIQELQEQYLRFSERDWETGGVSDISAYLEEYEHLERSGWPNLQSKTIEAEKNLNQTFRRNVLNEMHSAYLTMRHTIQNLNYILRKNALNDTIFEFCEPVAEPGKEAIFQMIKSENNAEDSGAQESIFATNMDNEFAETREEFFRELGACTTDKEKAAVLDYRRYCRFRILKRSASDPSKKADLADTYGTNSGSENQVPCYIILAAALINRYNQESRLSFVDKSDTIRLMMIDEAFNNMDEKNTKDLVRFLGHDLGLQLVIAAPSDKIDRLGENVNHIWLVQGDEHLRQRVVRQFSFHEYQDRGSDV